MGGLAFTDRATNFLEGRIIQRRTAGHLMSDLSLCLPHPLRKEGGDVADAWKLQAELCADFTKIGLRT